MKSVKVFIVTYDGRKHLENNLQSLYDSDSLDRINLEVNIINNHSKFSLDEKYASLVKIYHNDLRPDFSTGHLARNWNQGIINGFESLVSPSSDIVICCQDDILWKKNWVEIFLPIMDRRTFYTCGNGDAFHAYTVEGVKTIGLWDERFCNIGFQEYDYFTRAVIYNPDNSSINDAGDYPGNVQWNPEESCIDHVNRDSEKELYHKKSQAHHEISKNIYWHKWGFPPEPRSFQRINEEVKNTASFNYIYYPYFEKDVYDLKGKKYIIP